MRKGVNAFQAKMTGNPSVVAVWFIFCLSEGEHSPSRTVMYFSERMFGKTYCGSGLWLGHFGKGFRKCGITIYCAIRKQGQFCDYVSQKILSIGEAD